MATPEQELRKAVGEFVKDRVQVSTLYQRKEGNTWKNVNRKKRWNKTKQYRMVTRYRRRNLTIKHENLSVTFQQGNKLIFYKDSTYTKKQKDFTVGLKDPGNTTWQDLIVLHFKVAKNYKPDIRVWGGFISSTPQASVAIPFAAKKEGGQVET